MKVLITGAAGFIGYHAAIALIEKGEKVVGLDNFNDYYDPNLKHARADILTKKGVVMIQGDICNQKLLEELFDAHGFTHVLHLAAQAGVRYALKNPRSYVSSNIDGFVTLLEVCKQKPIPFIYASSSSVYGTNEKIPFAVTDRTDQPANLYAATKKANELIAHSYHHLFGIPVTGLRFFTVYGPWGRPDMAYFSFAKNILEGKPITLFNKGKMQRDFTYIDDVVQGMLAALNYAAPLEVLNIGNNSSEELMTMVSTLEELLGKKAILELEDFTPGEVTTTFADISDSQAKLNYCPTTSLRQGLEKFVSWYLPYHSKYRQTN